MQLKLAWVAFLVAQSASAQTNLFYERLPVGANTYTNVTLKILNPVEALLLFDGGGIRIKLEDLSEPTRSSVYNEKTASEYELSEQRKKAEQKEAAAEKQRQAIESWKRKNVRVIGTNEVSIYSMKELDGKISQVLAKYRGLTLILYHEVLRTSDSLASNGNFLGGNGRPVTSRVLGEEAVFVRMEIQGHSDGKDLKVRAMKTGTITLTNVAGGVITLDLYDTGKPYGR